MAGDDQFASFFGFMGCAAAMVFTGKRYATSSCTKMFSFSVGCRLWHCKVVSGHKCNGGDAARAHDEVNHSSHYGRCVLTVRVRVFRCSCAGIIAIYGLVVSFVMQGGIEPTGYTYYRCVKEVSTTR